MKAIHIRVATDADYPAAVPLMRADYVMHQAGAPAIFKPDQQVIYDAGRFAALAAGTDSRIWIAEQDGRLLGMAAMLLRRIAATSITHARQEAEIDYITVTELARRRGIGRALYQACLDQAANWGAEALTINAFAFNEPAIAFYRSMGFSNLYYRMRQELPVPKS